MSEAERIQRETLERLNRKLGKPRPHNDDHADYPPLTPSAPAPTVEPPSPYRVLMLEHREHSGHDYFHPTCPVCQALYAVRSQSEDRAAVIKWLAERIAEEKAARDSTEHIDGSRGWHAVVALVLQAEYDFCLVLQRAEALR